MSAGVQDVGRIFIYALAAVAPLAVVFVGFQVFRLKLPARRVAIMTAGLALSAAGLFLFLWGAAIAFLPFGRAIGEALASLKPDWLVVLIGLLLGLFTAWGEPSVRVLASQVEQASAGSIHRLMILAAICIGVAAAVAVGLMRIIYDIPLLYLLIPCYVLVIAFMWFSDRDFVAIGVDAGGVATGPFANTLLLAVALGAAAAVGGGNPIVSGLGLAALIAIAPIISLLTIGIVIRRKQRKWE